MAVKAKRSTTKVKNKSDIPASPSVSQVVDKSYKNDRSVELRSSVSLTANTVAQIQRALLMEAIAKNGEPSTLKLYLGPAEANSFKLQDQAALADTMVLVSHPVDVIIRSAAGPDVLKTMLSATNRIYILPGATLYLGVVTWSTPYNKNKANQVRRQLFNDYKTDLQTQLMLKTGITDRVKIYKDLLSARAYNALEALYYGKHGLIHGILMGPDQVITREEMNKFFAKQKWDRETIETFNRHYINVYKLPTRSLQAYSPLSIPDGTGNFYVSLNKTTSDNKDKNDKKTEEAPSDQPVVPIFYLDDKKLPALPMLLRASKDKPNKRIMIEQVGPNADGILDDDVIFFNDGFRDQTAEQIADALIAIDHKKLKQSPSSHIKIVMNSPGGSIWFCQELRSIIKSLVTPVDVIVQGMGASCGSWLLCSATGNRFATPHSRIMFHEAAKEVKNQVPHDHFNEILDSLDQATLDYIAVVSQATGRDFDEVLKDFDNDVWLNPVESLFYGDKGFIDGILVDHNQVITREDVEAYLIETLGSRRKMNQYVQQKILEKRDPRLGMEWKPEKHNNDDPFDNPLTTIAHVTTHSAKKIADVPRFQGSIPLTTSRRTIDFFNVVVDDSN